MLELIDYEDKVFLNENADIQDINKVKANDLNQIKSKTNLAIQQLKDLNTYSTEEVRIGTWIDGKPLYRKVFTGTKVSGSNTTINISELNVDHIYFYGSITGNADGSGGTYEFPINYYETSTAYIRVNLHRKYSNLTIKSSDGTYFNGTFNLIIEYTKTTDTATSTLSEVTE